MNITKISTTIISAAIIIMISLWWVNEVNPTGQLILAVTSEDNQTLVDDIRVTIESIELYNKETGWSTVMRPDTTISLQELDQRDKLTTLGTASLPPRNYDNIRLTVSKITAIDGNSETNIILPGKSIRIPAQTRIRNKMTSSIALTFKTEQALHKIEEDTYIMLPYIHLESRYDVTANFTDGSVSISAGDLTARTNIILDEDGNSRYSTFLDHIQSVDYDDDEGIKVTHTNSTGTTSSSN